MYLIYENNSKRVQAIKAEKPLTLPMDTSCVFSESFKEGDEFENSIFINEVSIDEHEEATILRYTAYKNSPSVLELLNKLSQSEADNLTTLEALAEVYEMLLTMQA